MKQPPAKDPRAENKAKVEQLDIVLSALSHQTRRQILMVLKHWGGEMNSGEIASRFSCAWPTITRHLNVLKEAELVLVERDGLNLKYKLNQEPMKLVWKNWFSIFRAD